MKKLIIDLATGLYRWWLQQRLLGLLERQSTIDRLLWEAKIDAKQAEQRHEAQTEELGHKRTAIRTALLRL
ncbi:hypothetical protein DXT88_22185 [Herbaspirillum lusitanum]|uniref:hypothetical protein n=1 Tax=Herbaspirillum lusitanum TaxID=213312 RepID=UPI0022378AD5|nr:hypothetical protein [Herbaspirillum lusitanum]MCW5300885.1 hypothetical protein [Herbaspirillum lusitanum]